MSPEPRAVNLSKKALLLLAMAVPLLAWAAGPDPFTFQTREGVAPGTTITSDSVKVTGFEGTLPVSVSGAGNPQYRVNGGGGFTSEPGTIRAGQQLSLRHTSASAANTETVTTVTVGDYQTTFTSVTKGETGPDADRDGVADANDNCPDVANTDQADVDGDGLGDACDTQDNRDSDGDGIQNYADGCPNEAGPASNNGCPLPDADGDGVPDASDNCPNDANADQSDVDGDGAGDACDTQDNRDDDGDGVQNYADQCPNEAGPASNNGCPVEDTARFPIRFDELCDPTPFDVGCMDDIPGVAELQGVLDTAWAAAMGGESPPVEPPSEVPGQAEGEQLVTEAAANAESLPDDLAASAGSVLDNAQDGALVQRDAEVVVMEGRSFPDWSQPAAQGIAMPYPNGALTGERDAHAGVMLYPPVEFAGLPTAAPVGEIVAYRRENDLWVEIPVQVDERFPYFLANPNSDFGIYSGTDTELTYAWDRETWKATGVCAVDPLSVSATPDPVPGLDDDDEVVFMAADAGVQAGPAVPGPAGTVGAGQEIALNDPLNPGLPRFVYLFRRPGGSSFGAGHYVHYERDANADQFVDRYFWADNDPEKIGTSNTGYGPNLSGTVCLPDGSTRQSSDRFPRDGVTISTDRYQVYASGRWMVRNVRIAKPGQDGVYGDDIVDRWKGRAFQQSPDSTVSLVGFEDEQVNWEANSALLGERAGPVRAIREVWGADSGTNVTKTETYYRDAYSYRYRVRVHPIPPDGLYTSWDYNRSAMVPAEGEDVPGGRYYTAVRGTGVPIDGRNDDVFNVDGVGDTPAYFDMADPTLNLPSAMYNWEQVAAKGDLGSLVYLFELKSPTIGANAAAVPYYRDDACLDDGTGDDPVQRPWPGESYDWNGGKVKQAYDQRAGRALDHSGNTFADCLERQGAHAQHGVHFFAPPESDNAFLPVPVDEIDGQQWAFAVPMAAPANVGEGYANVVRVPLVRTVRPRPAISDLAGDAVPTDYATCVAMAQEGGAEGHEAAAKFTCAVMFGGGREDGDIQGPNTYVPMDDGTLIATNIYIPWACNVAMNPAATPCASVLEMSGYESGSSDGQTPAGDVDDVFAEEFGQRGMPLTGGTRASHNKYYRSGERYVSVVANVRGSGCSAGEFDLFSRKSAMDGYQLVEWMARQPWSNGKVGVFGHSYSGITGAMIASTAPPHLAMVSISGQIGDIYRDIVYPGGVTNYGFPLLWTGAVRPAYDYLGGSLAGLLADSQDRQCAINQAQRSRTAADDPLLQGLSDTDSDWYRERSVVNFLKNVKAPTQIVTAYQDEQTGPRGGTHVFDRLPQDLTRRLVMLNGDHGSQTGPYEVLSERRHWMDRFLLDANDPNPNRLPRAWGLDEKERPLSTPLALPVPDIVDDGSATSRVLLEVRASPRISNGHIDSDGFPLAQTQWQDFYFQGVGATLGTSPESLSDGEAGSRSTWFNGSKRQFYSYQAGLTVGSEVSTPDAAGADELVFTLDVDSVAQGYGSNGDRAWVIAGPVTADLWISSTGTDTELMVQLIDADPATGERLYLQRGVLRASHREILAEASQCSSLPSGGRITDRACTDLDNLYRPFRPHVNPKDIVPGQATRYRLELFPVAHVFRPGHQLMVKVHAPSLDDNDWAYISKTAPALNTLHHSAEHPSSIRLPVIPLSAVSRLGGAPGGCNDNQMRCIVAGSDPTGGYRSQCHEYASQDPTGIGEMLCGGFDTLAGLLFPGGGGAGSGPGSAVGEQTGPVLNAAADAAQDLIGSAESNGQVLAGVGVVDMTPDVGYGAGQYTGADPTAYGADPYATGKKQKKSYGVMSRLTGRAIVVEGANGKRIALLKSDNYLAQDNLLRRVAQILAENGSTIGYDQILHGVTHAHSTAYYSTPSWGVWAFQDAFDARQFEFQARRLAEAILIAESDLRPARMGATTVRHKVFKGQIMGPATGDDGTPVQYPNEYGDLGLVVMRFDAVDEAGAVLGPIAAWVNWGEHPEGLDGYDLHSGDFVAFLERFVDRDLGAPVVFMQGDVGSAEKSGNTGQRIRDDGTVCNDEPGETCEPGQGVWRDWNHAGYVQNERNVRFLADAVIKGWKVIGGELPVDAPVAGIKPNNYVPVLQVPPSRSFAVDFRNAFVPGPLSHPYPSVSNCRSEPTAEGNPGAPVVGLPDCARASRSDDRALMIWESMKEHGIPVPEHYDAPAFTGVEENLRLKLQAFRLGDVILGSCACEAQVDLILNFESRANDVENDIYDGFDWACVAEDKGLLPRDPAYAAACDLQRSNYYDVNEFPVNVPGNNFSADAIARMRAQVHNPADGWDAPEYAPYANSEPADPREIKGNFTREELTADRGYKIAVGIGHAGDYNGYTVSYREYMSHDHYRKALTAYGAHTADYMVTRLVRMAGAMRGGPELAPEPHDAAGQADEARMVAESTALGQTTKNAYEAYYAALPPDAGAAAAAEQPRNVGLFDAATFTWTGGATAVDNPRVTVQRLVDGAWTFFADQSGEVQTRVQWPTQDQLPLVYAGQFEWRWTANFEAYEAFPARLGGTPPGTYRFVVNGCINDGSAPDANVANRVDHVLAAGACKGGASAYTLTSDPFEVLAERELVSGVDGDADGNLTIQVAPTSVPKTYASPFFPYLTTRNDNGRFCEECSFRPWATSASPVIAVTVTTGGQTFNATGSGDTWTAATGMTVGQQATVVATYADGQVSRAFTFTYAGDTTPPSGGGDGEPSDAPQLCAPDETPEIGGECLKDNGGAFVQDAVDAAYGAVPGL